MINLWSLCFVFVEATEGIIFFSALLFFFFGLGMIVLRLRTAELPGNSYFPRRTIWLVCWRQTVQAGTLTKEKSYFTSRNSVFHSTWNSRQETEGLFKKQFQANYDLKSALKGLWWKAPVISWGLTLPSPLPPPPFFSRMFSYRKKPIFI